MRLWGARQFALLLLGEPHGKNERRGANEPHGKGDPTTVGRRAEMTRNPDTSNYDTTRIRRRTRAAVGGARLRRPESYLVQKGGGLVGGATAESAV